MRGDTNEDHQVWAHDVSYLFERHIGFGAGPKPISQGEMSKYIVSAKAGVVNIVEGGATVTRAKPFATAEMLISGDELLTGDIVKTGPRGRVEVLLNPGNYLRLGEGSEFVFLFDSASENRIKL